MKKKYLLLTATLFAVSMFTACMDETAEPPVSDTPFISSAVSVGEVNTTIADLKVKYRLKMTQQGDAAYTQVKQDLVFEGVVVGNDISGNLYQKLVLSELAADGTIQSINLGIKNTNLYSYFPLGCTVRVNLNGLWIGNYGYVPTIGTPYQTSKGNLKLGSMLLQDCKTHVQLVEGPGEDVVKTLLTPTPIDAVFLGNQSNKDIKNTPKLVVMEGIFTEADGERIFTPNVSSAEDPENGYDDGYARNRNFQVASQVVLVRTSTRNEISNTIIPSGLVRVTGFLTYYGSDWQLQMRDLNDLEIPE